MGSSDLTDKADNLCCDNDNSVGASVDSKSQNMVNSASASDIFPPYKIAHSNSPDKGNLFDILKTNLTESSKPVESSNSQDSSDSGLSKGMMDKVSTFAASLQSKTLSGQLNIPSHLLQKSPTKDDQFITEFIEDSSIVPVIHTNSQSSVEGHHDSPSI